MRRPRRVACRRTASARSRRCLALREPWQVVVHLVPLGLRGDEIMRGRRRRQRARLASVRQRTQSICYEGCNRACQRAGHNVGRARCWLKYCVRCRTETAAHPVYLLCWAITGETSCALQLSELDLFSRRQLLPHLRVSRRKIDDMTAMARSNAPARILSASVASCLGATPDWSVSFRTRNASVGKIGASISAACG